MKTFTVHNVSPEDYRRLKSHLEDHLEFSFEESGGKHLGTGCGVEGAISHDGKDLHIELDSHSTLVTPGHLIGYLIDRLGESQAPSAAGAAK